MDGPWPVIVEAPAILAGVPSDEEICRGVAAGQTALFEVSIRRHDQRVYRAVRFMLREVEGMSTAEIAEALAVADRKHCAAGNLAREGGMR